VRGESSVEELPVLESHWLWSWLGVILSAATAQLAWQARFGRLAG